MEKQPTKQTVKHLDMSLIASITVVAILLFGAGFWSYYTYEINGRLTASRNLLASTTASFYTIIQGQRTTIGNITTENTTLKGLLTTEQTRRLELENIKVAADKQIDTLTKLTTIDPELLKKYSKVYFLSENYAPPKLKPIEVAYLNDSAKPAEILENAHPYLMNMLRDADNNQAHILVISGYRSFDYQKTLKTNFKVIYGAGTANQFSADQGYSEHQLGTAVDLGTQSASDTELEFQDTKAFKWLNENAYKYGFVISYPKANKFYYYEPWHWRFVGKQLAEDLHNKGMYFYEMDQREIDNYLIKLFD